MLRQHSFRLDDHSHGIILRWARSLEERLGHPVSASEAVRFILEGYSRAKRKLPEIGDVELFKKANSHGE